MTTNTSGDKKKLLHTLYNKLADLDKTRRNCDKDREGVEKKWTERKKNRGGSGSIEQRTEEIERWLELQRKSSTLNNVISDKLEEIDEIERTLTRKEKSSLLNSLNLD